MDKDKLNEVIHLLEEHNKEVRKIIASGTLKSDIEGLWHSIHHVNAVLLFMLENERNKLPE